MNLRIAIIVLVLFLSLDAAAQGSLPVKTWSGNADSTYVLLISGDGGLNNFTSNLCADINSAGYPLSAVNAKSYFWEKKTPEQTTADILLFLRGQKANKSNFHLCLLGYSFGADVVPYIVNRFPDSIKERLSSVILLSPSGSTDFEIHWSDMLGGKTKRSMDVVTEINRMNVKKVALLSGDEEAGLPAHAIHLPNCAIEKLPGGHHFDGNTGVIAGAMMKYIN